MQLTNNDLGLDKNGIKKVIRKSEYTGDAMGQIALNTITCLIGQITFFYTEKVGMSAAIAGTVLLIAKLVDAFTDIVMGRIVDKTNTKHGKARPWILWMIIPTFISIVTLFTIPANASSGTQQIYGVLSNIFASAIVYTAIAVPYYCLITYSTKSVEERGKMGTARAAIGYTVGIALGIGLIPITNMLGGDQGAWIKVSVVLAFISAIGLIITFVTTKERYVEEDNNSKEEQEKVSTLESLKMLFKNKYWVVMTILLLCFSILYAMIMGSTLYYAKYVLGNDNYVGLINMVNIIPSIIGFISVGPMVKRWGLAKTGKIGVVIGIIGSVVRIIFPANLMVTLVFGSLVMFATIPVISVGPAMVMNSAEYNYYKFGVKLTGMTNSANSFGMKIGSGIGGAMIGWILAFGGYNSTALIQSTSTINSIYALTIWIPAAMLVIVYFLLRQYDLEDKYEEILEHNAKVSKGK